MFLMKAFHVQEANLPFLCREAGQRNEGEDTLHDVAGHLIWMVSMHTWTSAMTRQLGRQPSTMSSHQEARFECSKLLKNLKQ